MQVGHDPIVNGNRPEFSACSQRPNWPKTASFLFDKRFQWPMRRVPAIRTFSLLV
jgi:hypothetical protein